ncbi:helix-turn-helix domain-containing protein [Amycolatopsis sp. cmx-4-83]|uniref:helix-turn-helix domain-containing protein n=1 Tax=Amycolatopsis sp. cmx-4-83 TaxID=2790940 RepID=UPI00397C3829
MQKSVRRCEKCGARMACDRVSNHCGSCLRLLITNEAPVQPDEFWVTKSIQAALESRHFGCLFAAYRKEASPRLSQAVLGRWLGLTQAQVSRLEMPGSRPPSDLVKLERWAKALRVPPGLLWFSVSHPSGELAGRGSDLSLERVHRRQFLKTAGVSATAIGASLLGAVPPSRVAARSRAAPMSRSCAT